MGRITRFRIVTASAIASVAVLYLGLIGWFSFMRTTDVEVDDDSLLMRLPPIADSENKFIAYLALTNFLDASDCEAFIHEMHNVTCCQHYRGPTNSMSQFEYMREIGNRWASVVSGLHEKGEFLTAVSCISEFEAFARCCRDNASGFCEETIGAALCAKAWWQVVRLAADESVPYEALECLSSIVREDPDVENIFRRTLKCEYSFWIKPAGYWEMEDVDRWLLVATAEHAMGPSLVGCASIVARLLAYTPYYKQYSCSSGAALECCVGILQKADFNVQEGNDGLSGVDVLLPNWCCRHLVSAGCGVMLSDLRRTLRVNQMLVRFVRVAVALHRYARKHNGQLPQSLSSLVPEYLDAVPKDPFDGKESIRYDAEQKVVWSVGENREHAVPPWASSQKRKQDFYEWAMRIDGRPWEATDPDMPGK